jgi:hypothetical protein
MKPNWKKTFAVAALSASLAWTSVPAAVHASESPSTHAETVLHQLTENVRAELKSVASERVGNEARIAAVVRLYNDGTRVTRVPDLELRAKTADGIEYKLQPSASNARAIQAKAKVELSYMLTLESREAPELAELLWVEVDEYVYPKQETTVLSIPVSGIVWEGGDQEMPDPDAQKQWGEPFVLSQLKETIRFAPVSLVSEKTPSGRVTVVTLLAENIGERTETVPDFRIDGKTDGRMYPGHRVEEQMELEPGEKKYLHYAIRTENDDVLKNLYVMVPETFVSLGADGTPSVISYAVGQFSVALPAQNTADLSKIPAYNFGDPIPFDPLNKLIDEDVDVSLVDLSMNETTAAGYQSVVAKFLIRNNGDRTIPLPQFQAELINKDGFNYFGTRQVTSVQQLAPNLSYVINYSFAVPMSESGDQLIMKILDSQTAAPYNIPIAGFRTAVRADDTQDDILSFYPYEVKLNYWTVAAQGSAAGYTYKLKLDVDIQEVDDVVTDSNASVMKIEFVDPIGRTIAEQVLPFKGQNALVSGSQTIAVQNLRTDSFEWPLTLRIYESIQTPTGEVKRLVKILK